MKKLFIFFILLACFGFAKAQQTAPKAEEPQMKQYFFVMLSRGPNRSQDAETAKQLQAGHMAHLNKMADDGKLNVAGPFGDDGNWRGILIFKTETLEEAKKLVEQDPMIKAGRLAYEIHPWWSQKGVKLD